MQYDIYSSWGGGDQNRPHYLQRQIDPERTTHKCNTTTDVAPGLLCSHTCVTAAQQQREGAAASCLCLSSSALCGPAPAVPAACSYLGLSAAAWARSRAQDSTPWHWQLLVRHCGTVRSPASAALAHDSAPTASLLPALLLGTWCQPHRMGTVSAAPAESCACGGGPVPGLVCLQCSLGAQAVVSMQDHGSQCPQHWCLLHVPCNVV